MILVLLFWAFHLSCGGIIIYNRDILEGYTGSSRSNVLCILNFTSILDYPQDGEKLCWTIPSSWSSQNQLHLPGGHSKRAQLKQTQAYTCRCSETLGLALTLGFSEFSLVVDGLVYGRQG